VGTRVATSKPGHHTADLLVFQRPPREPVVEHRGPVLVGELVKEPQCAAHIVGIEPRPFGNADGNGLGEQCGGEHAHLRVPQDSEAT
jgi:hypothetical protein